MSFRNQARVLDSMTYSASGQSTIDIPRGFLLRDIVWRFSGTFTATATGSNVYSSSTQAMIKRLEIVGNGAQIIKSIDAPGAYEWNRYYDGEHMENTEIANGNVQSATAIATTFHTPFAMPKAAKPIDTLLDTRIYDTLQARVTWGAPGTDMFDGTATLPTGTLTPMSIETNEPSGQLFPIHRDTYVEKELTATATEFTIDLPLGNIYRAIGIRVLVAGVVNDSTINYVSLRSNGAFYHLNRVPYIAGRQWNKVQHGINTLKSGYFFWDFTEDGYMTSGIDTVDITDLKLILDCTKQSGTTLVRVYLKEIVPVSPNATFRRV